MCCADNEFLIDDVPPDDTPPLRSCHWGLPRDGAWQTECGAGFPIALVDPEAVRFCPYCGGRVQKPRLAPRPPGRMSRSPSPR